MALSAVESVGDAIDVTREFLVPFDLGRWAKLAVITFLLSAGGASFSTNVPPLSPTLDPTYRGPEIDEVTTGPDGEAVPVSDVLAELLAQIPTGVLLTVALAVSVLAVAFGLVQAVAEFVFVDALRSNEVTVRRFARRWWRGAVALLAFRVGLAVAAAGIVGGAYLAVLEAGVRTDPLEALVFVAPIGAVVGVLGALVNRFTAVFVVPVMIREDRGLLSAWRRFWPRLVGNPAEFLAYAVIRYALGLVVAAIAAAVVLTAAALVGLALAVVGGTVFLASGLALSSTVGLALFGILFTVFLLVLGVVAAIVQVPIQSYLRYYALLVLGDVEPAFDLVAERRQRARERSLGAADGSTETVDR